MPFSVSLPGQIGKPAFFIAFNPCLIANALYPFLIKKSATRAESSSFGQVQ